MKDTTMFTREYEYLTWLGDGYKMFPSLESCARVQIAYCFRFANTLLSKMRVLGTLSYVTSEHPLLRIGFLDEPVHIQDQGGVCCPFAMQFKSVKSFTHGVRGGIVTFSSRSSIFKSISRIAFSRPL